MEQEPKTRVKDVERAQAEAETVNKMVGSKIDDEWKRLKLAQALGLEKKVEVSRIRIEQFLEEADVKMEDQQWESLLNVLFEEPGSFFSNPPGFKEYAEAKFGDGKQVGETGAKNVEIPGTRHALQFSSDKMNVRLTPLP